MTMDEVVSSQQKASVQVVAFLRGINVGGAKKVPMSELIELYQGLGHRDCRTVLNSGNILFESEDVSLASLTSQLEIAFRDHFGFSSQHILRRLDDLKAMVASDPFANLAKDSSARLYVSFLPQPVESDLPLPFHSPKDGFSILACREGQVFTALTNPSAQTVKAMAFLEREFGKEITTRNWNTILKIVKAAHG